MKRGTPEHPKTRMLAELLNIPLAHAVGILEMLWHFTAKHAPQGDIGKYSDKAIAEAVGWEKHSGRKGVTSEMWLSSALVMCRWLDSCPVHRLVVHDWSDHCDQLVTRFLARRKLAIVQTKTGLPLPLPLPIPLPSVAIQPSRSITTKPLDEWAEILYQRHPKKRDRVLVGVALLSVLGKHPDPDSLIAEIDRVHTLWCGTQQWREKDGQFAPSLAKWIDDHGWTKVPEQESPYPYTEYAN